MNKFPNLNNYDYRNNLFTGLSQNTVNPHYPVHLNCNSCQLPQQTQYPEFHFNTHVPQSSYSHTLVNPFSFYPTPSTTPSPRVHFNNFRQFENANMSLPTQSSFVPSSTINRSPVAKINKNKKFNKTKHNKNTDFSELSQLIKSFVKKFVLNFIESKIDEWLDELEEKAKLFLLTSFELQQTSVKSQPSKKVNTKKNRCEYFNSLNSEEQKPVADTNEVKAYNSEPFDQPCPIEEFTNKIVDTKVNVLPTRQDNIQVMEDKMNQYRQNYNFGLNATQNLDISTVDIKTNSVDINCNNLSEHDTNTISRLDNIFKNLPRNSPVDIITKNVDFETLDSLDNLDNLDSLDNLENLNKKEENNSNNNFSHLLNMFDGNDNLDLKHFIYGEILHNLSNQLNDSRIEQTINNLSSFMSKNNDNSSSSETSESESESDSEHVD